MRVGRETECSQPQHVAACVVAAATGASTGLCTQSALTCGLCLAFNCLQLKLAPCPRDGPTLPADARRDACNDCYGPSRCVQVPGA